MSFAANVLTAGILLLSVTTAQAGPTPEQQCQAGKSKVAGPYYACLQKASAKLAITLDVAKFDAAVLACDTKYDSGWEKQDVKAAAAGTTCSDGGAMDLEVRDAIAANWTTVQSALAGGPLPDCGNGTVEAPEVCDGSDLGGATCATQPGFVGGTLRCASGCTLDTGGCYAQRFVDNLDGTVTDNQTGLQWEKKDAMNGSPNFANPHDVDNAYSYTDLWTEPDGTLFLDFLNRLKCKSADGVTMTGGFAGHCDWRLPTIAELQTILLTSFPCATSPCIDPIFGPTHPDPYWSSTLGNSNDVWMVFFGDGSVVSYEKDAAIVLARAVRGGS